MFRGLVPRENAFLAPVASRYVDPSTLHEVASKPHAVLLAFKGAFGKTWVEKAEQPVEGRLVAAVRRRSQQDQMALSVRWLGA